MWEAKAGLDKETLGAYFLRFENCSKKVRAGEFALNEKTYAVKMPGEKLCESKNKSIIKCME